MAHAQLKCGQLSWSGDPFIFIVEGKIMTDKWSVDFSVLPTFPGDFAYLYCVENTVRQAALEKLQIHNGVICQPADV